VKLLAAKTIYWLGIVLLGVGLIACFGAIIWGFFSWFPPEHLMAMGIIIGGFGVLIGFGLLFNWAENYLNTHGGSKK
jgi:hypothetical protein